jgi:tetratricopeptide (TPR) repeat protein
MDLDEALKRIFEEAGKLIRKCLLKASDGTTLFRPDGGGNYNALWTRDFCYMLEGLPNLIPHDDAVKAYLYILNRQRRDGAIPDRVDPDGKPYYNVLGSSPPTDNPQFAVKIAWKIWRAYGDVHPFILTADRLEKALSSLPLSKEADLIWISPGSPHSSYGFTDCVAKTGEELFSSLLLYEAHVKMAELYGAAGRIEEARMHEAKAVRVKSSLGKLWSGEGYFFAASVDCRQPDVWGSAYSVWVEAVDSRRALEISKWLSNSFEKTVKWGQVRHLPEPFVWEKTLTEIKPGTYQNGAYWGTAAGWVAHVISLTNRQLAERMLIDLIEFCEAEGKAWECVNLDYRKCPDYVATLACSSAIVEKLRNDRM